MGRIAQAMTEAAYEVLIVLDSDCRIVAMNQQSHTFLQDGAAVGDLLADVTTASELVAAVQYTLENAETEFELQTNVHNSFYRARIKLFDDVSPPLLGVALQDVTELVRLNRARRDMVANISHELRTPIANIRLIIDSLFHEADKPKRKKSIQSLRAIARETDSLLWLVQELLDLSMIETGQAIVRMVDVPLDEIVNGSIERIEEQLEINEMTLKRDIPADMHVLCDADLVRRVLINLVHNAVKYAPKGTSITIHAEPLEEDVCLTVIDEGEGVPADQVNRIFERFYQVDNSRSRNEGTGLGLAICKHIVEAHGGKIWAVAAEEAGGGRFSFTLPRS